MADLKVMVADERKLYLPAYQSLFDFVTLELGYSEPAANRRIQAMRLMREVPEVEEKLESGKLSLSVAARAQSFIRQENKKRKEEKKELISKNEKLELVQQLEGTSARECEKKLIALSPETALPKEKTRMLTEDKTLIQFVADSQLMKKIEKLKSLMAHQNYERRYDKLFEKVIDMALEKLDPSVREARRAKKEEAKSGINKRADGDRFQIDEKKNLLESSNNSNKFFSSRSSATPTSELAVAKSSAPKNEQPRNRHIPQSIRDQVWVRDHGECQHQDPITGRVCSSRHGVQLDHIQPYALGGEHTLQNLQLLCGAHNRHRNFGEGFESAGSPRGSE